MARGQQHGAASSSGFPKPRRQRASPASLVKIYKELTEPQKKKIRLVGFGGLLKIGSGTLLAGFADWLMRDCYDAVSSELVFPGRGRIKVNVDAVHIALGIPKDGDEILYLDSLAVDNTEIPATIPRTVAWSKKLLYEVIKLDTNSDGSFGKLKFKETSYCSPQLSLFQMDDIKRFVSSKVPHGITNQKRNMLNTAISQFCSGFTEILGTFLEKISDCEGPASQRCGSSNRTRKRSKSEEDGPSIPQRQTRSRTTSSVVEVDDEVDEEEDDDQDFELDDSDSHQDEDDEEDDENEQYHADANLDPVLEDDNEGMQKPDDADDNVQPAVDVEGQVDDIEDHMTLMERIRAKKVKDGNQSIFIEPQPLEVIPAEPPKSKAQIMKEKLRLSQRDSPLDCTPPEINIMKFVETESGTSNAAGAPSTTLFEESACYDHFMSQISEEVYAKMENDAIIENENKKAMAAAAATEVETHSTSAGSDCSLAELSEEVWAKMESDALAENEKRKTMLNSDGVPCSTASKVAAISVTSMEFVMRTS